MNIMNATSLLGLPLISELKCLCVLAFIIFQYFMCVVLPASTTAYSHV